MEKLYHLVIKSHTDPDYRHQITSTPRTERAADRIYDGASRNLDYHNYYLEFEEVTDGPPAD